MTEPVFDHDRLDVYCIFIDYVAASFRIAKELNSLHRHARDHEQHGELKRTLKRIVSMSTRWIARADVGAEPAVEYDAKVEYEYRDAEYEYEHEYEHEHE